MPLQDHPYRNICDLRSGAVASLIELEFASHTGQDADTSARVPPGLPFYTLKAQLRELELVFLNRFLQARSVPLSARPAAHVTGSGVETQRDRSLPVNFTAQPST